MLRSLTAAPARLPRAGPGEELLVWWGGVGARRAFGSDGPAGGKPHEARAVSPREQPGPGSSKKSFRIINSLLNASFVRGSLLVRAREGHLLEGLHRALAVDNKDLFGSSWGGCAGSEKPGKAVFCRPVSEPCGKKGCPLLPAALCIITALENNFWPGA